MAKIEKNLKRLLYNLRFDVLKGKNIYNLDNIELDDIQKEIVEFIRRKQNV